MHDDRHDHSAWPKSGYLYRLAPDPKSRLSDVDSGWTFLAGTESQAYLDDPSNLGMYDVNTIANYDRDVIPFLDARVGSAFARDVATGRFVRVTPPPRE
jgi:hypothetical protein